MNLREDIDYIIVGDFSYKEIFLDLKHAYPNLSIKYITKKELLSMIGYSYDENSVAYLVKNHNLSYADAKEILSVANFLSETTSFKDIFSYIIELKKHGLLPKNEYGKYLFKNKKVLLFELKNDGELQSFLKNNGILFDFLCFSDLDFKKSKNLDLFVFNFIFDEINSLFTKISDLLRSGVASSDIYLILGDDNYYFYIRLFSEMYKVPVNYSIIKPYFSRKQMNDLLYKIYQKRSFDNLGNSEEENFIKDKLNLYFKDSNQSFEFKFKIIEEICFSTKVTISLENSGISSSNSPIYNKNAKCLLVGFSDNSYPKTFTESSIMKNEELLKNGINPVFIKNEIEKQNILNFLNYGNIVFLSFSYDTGGRRNNVSPLINEANISIKKCDYVDNNLYNNPSLLLDFSSLRDDQIYYGKNSDKLPFIQSKYSLNLLNSYDNSFKPFNLNINLAERPYSYTSLYQYILCPFAFYLENIVKLDPFESNIYTKVGNFYHKMLEKIYDKNYSFEKSYKETIHSFSDIDNKDLVLIENYKQMFYKTFLFVTNHRDKSSFVSSVSESNYSFYFSNGIKFVGKIDSIFETEYKKNKYYFIIDYKTSPRSFTSEEIQFGENLQLPSYILLLDNVDKYKNMTLGGAYYQLILPDIRKTNKKNKIDSTLLNEQIKYNGFTFLNSDAIDSFDSTFDIDKNSSVIKNLKLTQKGSFSKNAKVLSEDEIALIKKETLDIFEKTIENILSYRFDIAPTITKKRKLPNCLLCNYKDVCFMKENNIVSLSPSTDKEPEKDDESLFFEDNEDEENEV